MRIEVWKLRGSGNQALVAIRLVITTILLLLSITANIFPVNTTGLLLVIYLYDPLKIHLRSKSNPSQTYIWIRSVSYPNQIRIRFISDPNQIQIRSKSGTSQIRTRSKPDLNQIWIRSKPNLNQIHFIQIRIRFKSDQFKMFVLKMFAVILMPVCVSRSNLYVPI